MSDDSLHARSPVEQLIALLDLEAIEVNVFRGTSPKDRSQRVFGGQVLGQALVAASRTVDAAAHATRCTPIFSFPGDSEGSHSL